MKRWMLVCGGAVVGVAVVTAAVHAGMMCDAAALFDYKSPALNAHCAIEFLWSLL
jgi:F0F1-type ATP synthase membrane subunit c/vacuolar-type H+-ATPase subunit K